MKSNVDLYKVNSDVLHLLKSAKKIGWNSIKEQTVQRVMYLAKVLYLFGNAERDVFDHYHFSVSLYGPYSDIISRSVKYLISSSYLAANEGVLEFVRENLESLNFKEDDVEQRCKWIDFLIYILGKYGESRVFGFTIHDPLYTHAVETNQQRELSAGSTHNRTISFLNDFRKMFEDTLDKERISSLSAHDYLDLYFEYIFSKIISK